MDLEQRARWQHLVIFASLVGILCGMIMFIIPFASHAPKAAPWWVGAVVFTASIVIGRLAYASLRSAELRENARSLAESGVFRLPETVSPAIAQLNVDLIERFGIAPVPEPLEPSATLSYAPVSAPPKPPLPSTFADLLAAVHERAAAPSNSVRPAQHAAARALLARETGRSIDSIRFSDALDSIIPSGRRRFAVWQSLRSHAPALPDVTMNPWVENTAFYAFFAALIGVAVPIARSLDANPETRIENPSVSTRIFGKFTGLVLFGVVIAILMVPVHLVSRRFACRLPETVRTVGSLGQFLVLVPAGQMDWTRAEVESHLRDLVGEALDLDPRQITPQTVIAPAKL